MPKHGLRDLRPDEKVIPLPGSGLLRDLKPDEKVIPFPSFQNKINVYLNEFNKGLANVIALPGDAVVAIGDKVNDLIGIPSTGLNVRQSLGDLFDMTGITNDAKARSRVERYIGRIGNEMGAEVPGLVIGATFARLGREGGRFFGQIMKQFRQAPRRTAAIETVEAVGGGAGAQTATEIAPDSPTAEMLGQFAGSVVASAPATAAGKLAEKVRPIVTPFTKAGKRQIGREILTKSADQTPEELTAKLGKVPSEVKDLIGVQPTTAQATGSRGLLNLERATAKRSPEMGGKLEDVLAAERRGIRTGLEEALPPGRGEAVGESLERQIEQIKSTLQKQIDEANEALQTTIERRGGTKTREELNIVIRGQLIESEEKAQLAARDLFDAVDPDKAVLVETTPIIDAADNIVTTTPKAQAESIPPIARQLTPEFDEEGKELKGLFEEAESISEIMGLRSRLTTDIRKEIAQPSPDRLFIARLEKLKTAVDKALLDAPESGEAYEKAREFFRTEVAQKYRQGTVAKVLRHGRLGETSAIPESATISQFFKKGKGAKEAGQDFQRVLGNDIEAVQNLEEAVVQDYAAFVVKPDGAFDSRKATRWIAAHREALNQFPVIKQHVMDILKKGGLTEDLQLSFKQNVRKFEKSSARFFLDADPETAAKRILTAKNTTKELKDAVGKVSGNPEALKGLRRAIFDQGLRQAETPAFDETIAANFLSPMRLRRFFTRNRRNFLDSGLYTKEQLERVEKLIKTAEMVSRSSGAGLLGQSTTAADLQATTAYEIIGRVAGARVGRIFGTIQSAGLGASIGRRIGKVIGGDEAAALIEEALLDPKIARDLLQPVTDANERFIRVRLRAHLANLGAVAQEQTGEEAPQNPR